VNVRRRSVLAVAAIALTAVVFIAVLRRTDSPLGTGAAAPDVGAQDEPAAQLGALLAGRAARRPPRLITAPVPEVPGTRGPYAGESTPEQLQELDGLGRRARAQAIAAVALSPEQARTAVVLYHAADQERSAIEARMDGAHHRPTPARLWGHENRLLFRLMAALGDDQARALREAEAAAYRDFVREARERPNRPFPLSALIADRRLSAMANMEQASQEARHLAASE
jgi:hypothetical protein